MGKLERYNAKVFKISAIIEMVFVVIMSIYLLPFYDDLFNLVYFFSVPFIAMNTPIFFYSGFLMTKFETHEKVIKSG